MKTALLLNLLILCSMVSPCQTVNSINILLSQKRYDAVLKDAATLMAKEPLNGFVYEVIGDVYVRESKFDSSIPYLLKAISIDKDSSYISGWAHARLGAAYINTGQREQGIAELNRSVDLATTESSVNFAERMLDSIGYERPEKTYPENYLPDWVNIEGANISYHFQDTTGITAAVYKYIIQHEDAFIKLNSIFDAKLPHKPWFYVWNDKKIGKKIVHRRVGFTYMRACFAHEYRYIAVGHEMTHCLSYWAWGTQLVTYNKFITEGMAVAFDLDDYEKNDVARKVIAKYHITDVARIWSKTKKYKDRVIYPVGGAFVAYLYKNSTSEQFKAIVKNQTIKDAKKIYGADFDKLVTGFNRLMELN